MRSLIILLSTLLVFAGCNNSNRKRTHDKGFKYINHIKSEYGLSPRPTDIVILNLKITAPNDSILEGYKHNNASTTTCTQGWLNRRCAYVYAPRDSISFL